MIEDSERSDVLDQLERALGYRFDRRDLLEDALRHSSYAHELMSRNEADAESNERLEFLGDAVLSVVVAHAFFTAKPDWREGDLTRATHALVEARSLEKLARSFELGSAIQLGRTERQSGGHEKPSILSDAMEAVLGAIYLDGGLDAATAFVEHAFGDALGASATLVERDPKTEFQERLMAAHGEFPTYRVVADSLVEGDDERFTVEVLLRGEALASAVGRTKRAAERRAAAIALESRSADDPVES